MKKKIMTEEERKERKREKDRRYYLRHKEQRKAYSHQWYLANRDRMLDKAKMQKFRILSDPDLYAKFIERRAAWRTANRKKINAQMRQWKKMHKRRVRISQRLERDRRKVRFRECPELYAEHRRKHRMWKAARLRRLGLVKRAYVARTNMRIPDTCGYGRALDTRSVFLWNNLPAASFVAGRAYRAMQWRETHCDRFGMVCR